MSEAESKPGEDGGGGPAHHKRSRPRKKRLFKSLQQQMEFYFSDSNLSKDRFMKNLLKDTPQVDLSLFLTFNKIKALTTSVTDLSRALEKSQLLGLTPDGTKVYRITPVKEKEDIDDCTIYVEQLPPFVTHEWLKGIFSEYGPVSYVSIPRFRKTGRVKGFAFVEYDNPDAANRALEAFGAAGCCLPVDMAPDKLKSIRTYEAAPVEGEESGEVEKKDEEGGEDDVKEEGEESGEGRSRKRGNSERDEDDESDGAKRRKVDSDMENGGDRLADKEDVQDKDGAERIRGPSNAAEKCESENAGEKSDTENDKNESVRKRSHVEKEAGDKDIGRKRIKVDDEPAEEEAKVADKIKAISEEESEPEAKKARVDETEPESKAVRTEESEDEETADDQKKEPESAGKDVEKKKKKKRRKFKKQIKEQQEVASIGLQIMSKHEWKHLRNQYLNLQWANMKRLKQQIRESRRRDEMGDVAEVPEEIVEEQAVPEEAKPEKAPPPPLDFTPGVVIKVTFDVPLVDVKEFKKKLRVRPGVKYVDAKEGGNEGFVRCDEPATATALAESKPEEYKWSQAAVLTGAEEEAYWEKIQADRGQKLSGKLGRTSSRPRERGRQRIVRKALQMANKHIHFDD